MRAALSTNDPALAGLAWYDLGVAALEMGDLERARDAFFDALALTPFDREARFNLEIKTAANDAVEYAHEHDHTDVGIEPGVEDQGARRVFETTRGRRNARDDGLEEIGDPVALLGRDREHVCGIQADHVLDLGFDSSELKLTVGPIQHVEQSLLHIVGHIGAFEVNLHDGTLLQMNHRAFAGPGRDQLPATLLQLKEGQQRAQAHA